MTSIAVGTARGKHCSRRSNLFIVGGAQLGRPEGPEKCSTWRQSSYKVAGWDGPGTVAGCGVGGRE